MNLFFLHPTTKDQENVSDEHIMVATHEHPHNTNEGSEFLDDAIRTVHQPLTITHAEVKIVTGNHKS